MLDTVVRVETPEGIALRLRAAGVMPRAAAWAVDFVVRAAVAWIAAIGFAFIGDAGAGLYLIVLFALYWSYGVLFEVLRDGQTIGKRAMGLRVVNANGTPVTWMASIARNLLRVVDGLPVLYAVGVVTMFVDPSNRRLGDMVAGTLVVHTEAATKHAAAPAVAVIDAPLALLPDERRAVVAFAERAQHLTPERQRELAALLPMLTEADGDDAVRRLYGIAASLLGRRDAR